jgi:CRISPR/Cas system-associated endoribonuclease Cas2
VATLASNGNVEERVQASVDVGETSTIDVNKIKVELQKLIDMIEEQEIVVPNATLEQNNVQPHVEIDGGDTLNFIFSNYLPHPSFQ